MVEQAASFVTDGIDGKIEYTTVADDLDQVGMWRLQGEVTFPTGAFPSDKSEFQVMGNLS